MKASMYRLILLAMISFTLFGTLNAQIGTKYAFAQATAPWQPIWGNYATAAMTDEGISTPIDIGFTFKYGSNNYTQVKLSSNGWVGLGTTLTQPYWNNDLTIFPLLAPLWDDLDLTTGAVQYGGFGLAPHRIFIMQWLAAKWNANGNNEFNFMVRMHETGQIDYIYGPHTGSANNPSASIGMSMAPGGPGNYFSILPGLPAQIFSNQQYQNLQVVHPSGLLYLFSPKTAYTQNGAAVNLMGSLTPRQDTQTELIATFANAGTAATAADAFTGYLMRGEEILSTVNVPAIQPGGFVTMPVYWTPDTTGVMQLCLKAQLANDADSLNDKSYPLIVEVLPPVGNDDQTITPEVNLLSCYPNPFNTETTISYNVKTATAVKLEVFNLKGQKVRELVRARKAKGDYAIKWDGKDDNGKPVTNGVYFSRLSANRTSLTGKIILLK